MARWRGEGRGGAGQGTEDRPRHACSKWETERRDVGSGGRGRACVVQSSPQRPGPLVVMRAQGRRIEGKEVGGTAWPAQAGLFTQARVRGSSVNVVQGLTYLSLSRPVRPKDLDTWERNAMRVISLVKPWCLCWWGEVGRGGAGCRVPRESHQFGRGKGKQRGGRRPECVRPGAWEGARSGTSPSKRVTNPVGVGERLGERAEHGPVGA